MDTTMFLLLLVVAAVLVVVVIRGRSRHGTGLSAAQADARAVIDRLAGEVGEIDALVGSNEDARRALADARERHVTAGAQVGGAGTPAQALLAKRTALEGLREVRAARIAMDLDPGPEIDGLDEA